MFVQCLEKTKNTLKAFDLFLESIKDNTKLKENLLRFWSGTKILNRTRQYQLSIRDDIPANTRPFPTAHTCFYQLEIYNVNKYPGASLGAKTNAFIRTMIEAITHYSAAMNMVGGRKRRTRRIRRVTKTKKRSHKNKHTKNTANKHTKKHRK